MPKLYFHSMSDITTNSSSEMFIYNGEKNIEEIEEILHKFVNEYFLNIKCPHCGEMTGENLIPFDQMFGSIHKATKLDIEIVSDYNNHACSSIKPGKSIIINSNSDNTIPWEIQEKIENFGTYRVHLG